MSMQLGRGGDRLGVLGTTSYGATDEPVRRNVHALHAGLLALVEGEKLSIV